MYIPIYYEEHQQNLFWAVMVGITLVSVLGSIAIIISYIVFPQLRNANSRIIVCLSIADLGTSACGGICGEYLFHRHIQHYAPNSALCQIQAAAITYFSQSSIVWLGMIAISNYSIIIRQQNPSFLMELCFHLISWGFPLIPTIIALSTGTFGYYHLLWCSFSTEHSLDLIISLSAFIAPVTIAIVFAYYSIITHVRKENTVIMSIDIRATRTDTKAVFRMTGYILNYFLGWFPYFLATVYSHANPNARFFVAQTIISTIAHSQGFTNFLVYCFNRSYLTMLRRRFFPTKKMSFQISTHRVATTRMASETSMSLDGSLDSPHSAA